MCVSFIITVIFDNSDHAVVKKIQIRTVKLSLTNSNYDYGHGKLGTLHRDNNNGINETNNNNNGGKNNTEEDIPVTGEGERSLSTSPLTCNAHYCISHIMAVTCSAM